MAEQPATRARERRPVAGQPPEPLGPRALRIGLRTTLLAPLAAASGVAILDGGRGLGGFLPIFLALVAVGGVVAFLPWGRLSATTTGGVVLHAWAALDVVLITLAGWSAAAPDAALPIAYGIALVFFALLLPPRSQLAFLAFLLACYGAVLLSAGFEPLPFAMLAVLGLLASFLSRELRRRLDAHDQARIASERRWAVVGSVSSVARDLSASEPRRVLQGVVEAVLALGYPTAAIHLPGERGDLQVVLPEAAAGDPTRGIRTLPESIRARVLDEGRDAIVEVQGIDRQQGRGLRSSGLHTVAATPIIVGVRPEGVLLVGSTEPISTTEVEAFAMLAATAALALGNARRADERREVESRLADADAVRAEILASLSAELRKPLAAVTETSRALGETFGGEDRHRLLRRLRASASALDVTLGGSLDLSLLDAGAVELRPEPVDVGELVGATLERLSGLFEGRQVRANTPVGLTVEADRALLETAVEHLLATAATSSPPGKVVEVHVSRTGSETTVKVAGEGTIPADQLARIARATTEGGASAGPWIRLALAARIVEAHGSRLEIRSEPKQGTKAWFQLPAEGVPGVVARRRPAVEEAPGPVQLSLDDALLPAVAAVAAAIRPDPVEVEQETERGTMPFAAAALAATAATSLAITGVLPDLLPDGRPGTETTSSERRDRKDGQGTKERRRDRERDRTTEDGGSDTTTPGAGGTGTSGASTGGTTGGTSGGSTGGTGDGTSGGGTGGGTGTISPSPSPAPAPGNDGDPGKSGEAPGHNKTPSPSPSPSPSPAPSASPSP